MAYIRTEAVILRALDYSDSSKILTLLSPAHGLVSTIAKGAKRPKSPFLSSTETLSHVAVVYADKGSREVQTLTQCDVIDVYTSMKHDLTALAVASYLSEIAGAVAQARHAEPALYANLCAALTVLDAAPSCAPGSFLWGARRLLEAAGIGPSIERCVACGETPQGEPYYWNPRAGGVTCNDCHQPGSRKISRLAYSALVQAGEGRPQNNLGRKGATGALEAIHEHVTFHIGRACKSYTFLHERFAPAAIPVS